MRSYLRAPFIISLFLLSIVMSLVASVPVFRLVASYELPVKAAKGDVVLYLNSTGIVRVRGQVPDGVRVYLLSAAQYWDYLGRGELPGEYLGAGGVEELVAEDPFCLLVRSQVQEAYLTLEVEVYERDYRYAMLSIPAYLMAVAALMLLFMRLATGLRAEVEERRAKHPDGRWMTEK